MNKLWLGAVFAMIGLPVFGQMQDNQERSLTCNDHSGGDRLARHCEIKEQTLAAPKGPIAIDPGSNGGISIKGWSRNDVLVRARIDTAAPSDSEARAMTGQVQFASGAGQLKTSGPVTDHDHRWSVSYEVFVPHQADIDARSHNGGIRIQDVKGHIAFQTVNGGVHLARLAGEVSGQTTNGGLHVELMGTQWDGKGLDLKTTNGGVKMTVPANFSAHVETSTVNGGVHLDFPIQVQGKLSKNMSFDIGSGGPTIRAVTVNGGVHIQRAS